MLSVSEICISNLEQLWPGRRLVIFMQEDRMRRIVGNEVLQCNNVAIKDENGNEITYKELLKKAERLEIYIEKRSFIILLCDHQIETEEFLYEILYLNFVPLLLPEDINKELLENLINNYKPQYIYCKKNLEICRNYVKKVKFKTHILLDTNEKKHVIHPDIAVLLSTSGTTGSLKLVKLSYDNLYYSAKQVSLLLNIHAGQKGITHLSMSYVYGLTFRIWHWYCGATLLVTEEPVFSSKFNKFYKKERANNFAGTPYSYQMLRRVNFWDLNKLEYLHCAISGGSRMADIDQVNTVSVLKDKFWVAYGQTESTGMISGMNFDINHIKVGSVGRVLEGVEAYTEPKTKELVLKGKMISMGYVKNIIQLAEGDINHSLLHTGDTGYIDDEGCIYLQGRLTRYVKVLGKRVSLDELEYYLASKVENSEFACVGNDDNIFVFCTNNSKNIMDKVLAALDQEIKIPKKFVFCKYIKEIPKNNAGKIRYAELKELKRERIR